MLIYYSGNGRAAKVGPRDCAPENVLKGGQFMLTFAQLGQADNNQCGRFAAVAVGRLGRKPGVRDGRRSH